MVFQSYIFITITCNPKWPEITEVVKLIEGQRAEDRPDIVARVFKIRLKLLMEELIKKKHFGEIVAGMYTIEFQKCGLPHAHILLWLHPMHRCISPSNVDKIISAEIPDKSDDPVAYKAVLEFMVHSPCGVIKPGATCMAKMRCTKHYPKKFQDQTVIPEDGFTVYRQRNQNNAVKVDARNDFVVDNRDIVPHNKDLLVKFQCHMNVELCNKTRSIKYLFKYVSKGPDRAKMILENEGVCQSGPKQTTMKPMDEVQSYLDCRYVSAQEACWRIYAFDIHYRHPAVERLSIHLPRQHNVSFHDDQSLLGVLAGPHIEKTQFNEWLAANVKFPSARTLTYTEFPQFWVWSDNEKAWKHRKQGKCIGRIIYIHPASILLNIVKGPQSYEDIRTVYGILYSTFQEACNTLGLLNNDKEKINVYVNKRTNIEQKS